MLAVAAGVSIAVSTSFSALADSPLPALAEKAVSPDTNVAAAAIAQLRAEGPPGLDALLNAHSALIQQHDRTAPAPLPSMQQAAWLRLKNALDGVSAQHDCYASRLYWYTNFDAAKAAAKAAGKPILSLRLLGNLNEEYSCANSRYFRTTLYANAEVSQYLRDHFILHWKSVRPVPRITVDFGDGRKIERTVTGNSIHYILDSDGNPVDALPGLYGPKAFLKGLVEAQSVASQSATLAEQERQAQMNALLSCSGQPLKALHDERGEIIRQYHERHLVGIRTAWRKDLLALGKEETLQPKDASDALWAGVAALHAKDATLDGASVNLIKSKNPTAIEAGRRAISKAIVENPLTVELQNLERSIAEDTVRNEYLFHSQIDDWFIHGTVPDAVDALNGRVYAELFLTPNSDPWLGLAPANTFTGLEDNGLVQASRNH